MENKKHVLSMKNVGIQFNGNYVLKNFNLDCYAGEVHVLMGENGAGKSTLLKILNGLYQADIGDIYIEGKKAAIHNTLDAKNMGISMIHQELSLCENMTVAENVFRGNEPLKGRMGLVDFEKMNREAQVILDQFKIDLCATDKVGELSIAKQQMVEICSALSHEAKIIIMDEPTASLTEPEVETLFEMIKTLQKNDVCIIYVSHRMNETFEIGDRVTIMRDGSFIGTKKVSDTSVDELITMMVGRPLEEIYSATKPVGGEVVLKVENFENEKLKNVCLEVKKGEILGIAGLVGAGRSELARAIFGLDAIRNGTLYIENRPVEIRCPSDAIKNGIGYVPEDRKGAGLILNNSVAFNLTITVADQFISGIFVDHASENSLIEKYCNALSIKISSPQQLCKQLSGGNQQKIVISKWLATGAKFIILDEPTRGIDIAAKSEIYHLITELANEGVSVIFISSDLVEIINVASRVAVMYEGQIAGVLDNVQQTLTQEQIMKYATGGI